MAEKLIFLFSFLTLSLGNLTSPRITHSTAFMPSCRELKIKAASKNFSVGQVFASDEHLDICVNNRATCCTRPMEKQLRIRSRENVRDLKTAKTDLIRKIFSEGVTKFKDFFADLIDKSEEELDRKFTNLYKNAYANNSHVTRSFYAKLRKHYTSGAYQADKIVNDFFKEVLKKVYLLLNVGKSSQVDLDCIGATYDNLKPFGLVPRRLIPQIERSFTAARTFVYGLLTGKSVVEKIIADKWLSEICFTSITKMTHCSVCVGYKNLKPCAAYCKTLFGQCLSHLTNLEKVWDEFLKVLTYLALKLEGPYNFDAVTGELPYDISNGIMNCQESLPKLLPKIAKYCKKGHGKIRRSLASSDNDFFLVHNSSQKRTSEKIKTKARNTLGRLTQQYIKHFESVKKFWSKLPEAMCDETIVANNATDFCWDGSKLVNNTRTNEHINMNETLKNENDATVKDLVHELRSAIKIIKAAESGQSVQVPTTFVDHNDFSGSGSGSGEDDGSGESPDNNPTSSNEIPEQTTDSTDNDRKDNEIENRQRDPDGQLVKRGEASYLHTCVALLISSAVLPLLL